MINTENTKYEGMGFVEALIAIMIVGISSVVLMQMASSTLKNMIQNEVIDNMTQYAVEGATMIQNVAMQEKTTGEDVFPNPTVSTNNCYVIDINTLGGQYSFRKADTNFVSYTLYEERDLYKTEAVIPGNDLYFRIFCIEPYLSTNKYAIVKVIVGQTNTNNGEITKGNNVKDYTYFTVANL